MQTFVSHLPPEITVKYLAETFNITTPTVSRALNDHPRISAATKKTVLALAERMNYRRNRIASSLRSGKTHTIGVIIPSAEINFFGSVVHGIESIANTNGYKAAKEMNIAIPGQLGVIGFANESFDEYITPSLSSMDQQTVLMGKEAFKLLLDLIYKKDLYQQKKR